jgi:hypothetical protein
LIAISDPGGIISSNKLESLGPDLCNDFFFGLKLKA